MTKNNGGQWVRLSPRAIYLRFLEIEEWRKKAEKGYGFTYEWLNSVQTKILSGKEKAEVNKLLQELLRKTGAPGACEVMTKISKVFDLKDLVELCTQQKFSGMLGINHVVNLALSSIFDEARVKKNFTDFGGVSVDHGKVCKLGVPVEIHHSIQEKINEGDPEINVKLFSIFEQIRVLHEHKMYPWKTFLTLGEEIQDLTGENPMSYMLYQVEGVAVFSSEERKKNDNRNFYSNEIVKKDGGFFQDLCVLILSYEFPKNSSTTIQ